MGRKWGGSSDRTRENNRRCYYKNIEQRAEYRKRPEVIERKRLQALEKRRNSAAARAVLKETKRRNFIKLPWRTLLSFARSRASQKGMEFDLTSEWAIREYTGFCSVTGIPFVLSDGTFKGPHPFSPSIDRRNSSLGYTQNNCRFVLFSVNAFKGRMSESQMLEVARAIVNSIGASSFEQKPVCIDGAPSGDLVSASRETARALLNRTRA